MANHQPASPDLPAPKRRRLAAGQETEPQHAGARSPDSQASMATTMEPVAGISDLDQLLSVPTPDKELEETLESLGKLIQQHVEGMGHYIIHKQLPTGPLSMVLWDLGLRDGPGGSTVPSLHQLEFMVVDPNKRITALQHIIARLIFGSLSIPSVGNISMLPPGVSSLVQEIPRCQMDKGDSEAFYAALTRWRQITAFLLNSSRSERVVLVPSYISVQPRARQLVKEMNKFLGVFVDQKNRHLQMDHLEDVVVRCTILGYSIFSQPANLRWEFESGDDNYVVVCPGLVKVSDSQGVRCQPEMTIPPELDRV
ncbi:hypothetical protein FJTKL_07152 [Diaporthe vaccinii]|uniref:Uncharacterized protein n=1 Tax=Diaporthe vaccinii TaxID=105482 RepID=A0ABR4EVC8_9PEZI